jgi:hypothetical protein
MTALQTLPLWPYAAWAALLEDAENAPVLPFGRRR